MPLHEIGQDGITGGDGEPMGRDKGLENQGHIPDVLPVTREGTREPSISCHHRHPLVDRCHIHQPVDIRKCPWEPCCGQNSCDV